ncbi:hypothetical protein C4B68_20935 [Streptomyces dengpaensis]|uniref:Uncharacterized protein n=1 Tax=Streptomyces dengpaensis TaxID=2049881 RepID=A0ABN5I4A1_9ACTN|nr:hypothetical protein C4B68_20935 [Streptomyces dengpaensis]
MMYRHDPSRASAAAGGWGRASPTPRSAVPFGPSGEGGFSPFRRSRARRRAAPPAAVSVLARPAFEDEAVQAETGVWGRQPPGTGWDRGGGGENPGGRTAGRGARNRRLLAGGLFGRGFHLLLVRADLRQ